MPKLAKLQRRRDFSCDCQETLRISCTVGNGLFGYLFFPTKVNSIIEGWRFIQGKERELPLSYNGCNTRSGKSYASRPSPARRLRRCLPAMDQKLPTGPPADLPRRKSAPNAFEKTFPDTVIAGLRVKCSHASIALRSFRLR